MAREGARGLIRRSRHSASSRVRAVAVLHDLPRLHVVDIADVEHVVGFVPRLIGVRVVVHRDLPPADHFEPVAGDDNRGVFRQPEAEILRILLDDRNQIVPPQSRVDVLVDRGLLQEREAMLMIRLLGHHDVRALRVAADEVVALNRGAGRAARDHAAAVEHIPEFLERARVHVRVDHVPLAATVEPDRVGIEQRLHELFRVGDLRVPRVQHDHVRETALLPGGEYGFFLVDSRFAISTLVAAIGRHDHELLVRAAGQLVELLRHAEVVAHVAADDDERALGGAVLRHGRGRYRGLLRAKRQRERQSEDEDRERGKAAFQHGRILRQEGRQP